MTTPTPAQIEAAATEILRLIQGTTSPRDLAKAALTAAAEVGTEAEENHRMGFISATAADGSKWDRWYASLPSDLRRKLSLHDFKRLGDLFDTAAAEVGEPDYELKCTNGHDRCYMGTSDDCPYCERIPPSSPWDAATIERCAQALDKRVAELEKTNDDYTLDAFRKAAAIVRELKERP